MSKGGASKTRMLSTLLVQHQEFLVFLERRVGTKADAEDILQSAFAKTIENDAGPRDEERIIGWFYQVLRNALSDHYRRRESERKANRMAAHAVAPLAESELDVELERVVCRCVTALLGTLKPEYADILEAVELRGRPLRVSSVQGTVRRAFHGRREFLVRCQVEASAVARGRPIGGMEMA